MGSIVMTEIKVDNIVNVAGTGKPNFPVAPTHSSGSALSTINTYQYDTTTRVVTVVSDGGNKYAIDGVTTPTITLLRGVTYTFDLSDSSNSNHPLAFKNGGTSYTTGVTSSGTAGTAGATVTFAVAADAPLTGLTYYCTVHGDGMGSSVTTSNPNNGAMLWDGEVKFYLDSEFKAIGTSGSGGGSGIAWGGARGFRFGGYLGSNRTNVIDYWAIATPGNAQDFGDLTKDKYWGGATSNGTRAITAGGYYTSNTSFLNDIDYITCATTGNAVDFGDMSYGAYGNAAVGDGTKGCIFAGYAGTTLGYRNNIEYVTISTTGNATDIGDMLNSVHRLGGWSDATRGLIAGGSSPATNVIQYFTIQSTSNALDFGDLSNTWYNVAGGGDDTRSCFMSGYLGGGAASNMTDTIEYVTTQTTGNSTDFGDLVNVGLQSATACDGTYCCVIRGQSPSSASNVIERFTVQTLGNAADFGDITETVTHMMGAAGNAA